jgi:methionine-rich copper-binding protein CopC
VILAVGTILENRYRIDQLMGYGGMGALYRAYDTHLQRVVAIKENTVAALGISEEAIGASRRQFEREALVLARVRHINLPHVSDHFVTPEGNQYLVMDFIEGEDLAQLVARTGPLPETLALSYINQVCDALEYLHSLQPPIIHRDIKPQNIKVTPTGQVFLVDFGIAKVGGTNGQTLAGAVGVTRGFSPPEQHAMSGTDVRSDIYSLGATLYALVTGQVPPDSVSLQSGEAQLTLPRLANQTVSPTVQDALLTAMATRRTDRPQTVREFRRMLPTERGGIRADTMSLAAQGSVPTAASAHEKQGERARAAGLWIITESITSIWRKTSLRLAVLGAGAAVVLVVALALSLFRQQTQPVVHQATPPVETAIDAANIASQTPVAVASVTEIAPGQTEVPQIPATISATFSEITVTVVTATRQAEGILGCDTVQFDVLKTPASIQVVKVSPGNVELMWRVRNKPTTTSCQWGVAGEETQLLRAVTTGEQASISAPVKLTWKANDEYDLSLKVQLGWGSYTLRWRLVLPNADLPAGPELQAKVNVVVPPTPTPTRTPTVTPCPTETYQCNCRYVCVGRDCTRECDECTRVKCP